LQKIHPSPIEAFEYSSQLIESTTSSLGDWARRIGIRQRKRLLSDIGLCAHYCPANGKMLDVGCAPFFTTIALHQMGYDIQGVDIDPNRFDALLARAGLKVVKCDFELEPLPYSDGEFDLILLSEVFEHLRINLITTMREIRRVLKPGGILLLSTPNFMESRKLSRLLIRGRTGDIFKQYNRLAEIGHMGHVREYTAGDVKHFFNEIGFQCRKTVYRGIGKLGVSPAAIAHWLIQYLMPPFRKWFLLVLEKKIPLAESDNKPEK